ncbi:MAG: MMPL family transporter [Deltaproteobacteria bacterium]|nr:MMPL family transporter [Deltaproteobacteria bacterium]
MKILFTNMRQFFEGLPEHLRNNQWKVWVSFILLTIFMIAGIPKVKVDANLLNSFEKDDAAKLAFDQFKDTFGSDEVLYIVYKAKDGDVFSRESILAMQGIERDLENYRKNLKEGEESPLDHITKVTTLSNASYLEGKEGSIVSRDFIGTNIPETIDDITRFKKLANSQPDYVGTYYSKDYRYGGIVVETDFNAVPYEAETKKVTTGNSLDDDEEVESMESSDLAVKNPPKFKQNIMKEYIPFMSAVSKILNKPEYTKHLTFYNVGTPPWNSFISNLVAKEMGLIIMGSLLIILIFTAIIFRSFSAVLWQLSIVVTSLIWVMGTIGWIGAVMSDLLMMVVFFVLAVGVADAIHILSGYLYFRNQNLDHTESIKSVYKKSGLACFLTSITTAIGFLSMLFIPIASMQKIGIFSAFGVFYAFLITVFMLPVMLDLWSPVTKKVKENDKKREDHFIQQMIQRVEKYLFRYPKSIVLGFLIVTITLSIGVFDLNVESNTIKVIKEDLPIRKNFALVDDVMGGTQNMEILVDTGRPDGMKNPEILKAIESLQIYLETRFTDSVKTTMSLANVTKDSFKSLNNGDQNKYIIPEDKAVLENTLFLFNNANPVDRRRLVSDDYQMGRIIVRTVSMSSKGNVALMDATQGFIDKNLELPLKGQFPNLEITLTGQTPLLLKVFDYLSWSFLISFGITICVVSLFLFIMLNSFRLGVVALIPNILPVLTVLGIMGYFKIPLDIHTLMIVPVLIGIAVDDTIHFLTHYELEIQTHGDNRLAIVNSLREAGQAIIFTSLVLSIGFLIFTTSSNMGFVYFGLLNTIAIITAVVADLILLPAVLTAHEKTFIIKTPIAGEVVRS